MKIGISGAGGQMGAALARYALGRTAAADIVAITRNPAKLEELAKRGVERADMIPTGDLQPGVRIQQHTNAINAAAGAGVRHLIYISTVSPRPDPNNSLLDSHFATEQALIGSGMAWTILRMSVYMDTLVDAAKRAAASGSYAAVPGAPAAYVTRDDIAAAAAGIVCTAGHVGITYHATGPASLSQAEIAETIGKAAGKPVAFVETTEAQQRAGLEAAGLPTPVVNVIVGFQAALRAGAFDLVTGDAGRLAGRPAEPLLHFLGRALAA